MTNPDDSESRILLHALTADAVVSARSHVVKAEAAVTMLDMPDADARSHTWVRPNALAKIARTAPALLTMLTMLTMLTDGAVRMMTRMQSQGGCYVRA